MASRAWYYQRSLIEELPKFPINGPLQELEKVTSITFHHTGASVIPDMNHQQEIEFLKRTNRDYWTNRKTGKVNEFGLTGYAIGYNWAVFESGRIYELRGFKYRCAANGTTAFNEPSTAILVITGFTEVPTEAQVQSVRNLCFDLNTVYGRQLEHKGHRDWKPTECPGNIQYKLVKSGYYLPVDEPITTEPEPTLPVGKEFNGMLFNCFEGTARWTVLFWNGVELKWISSSRSYNLLKEVTPIKSLNDDTELFDIIQDSKTIGKYPTVDNGLTSTLNAPQLNAWIMNRG